MKTKVALLATAAACSLFAFNDAIYAQGTAFTYQGRLSSGTNAANGTFDVQFTLYAINSGGSAVAGPVVKTGIGVTNGLFTTTVDFGSVFAGSSSWLELAVRTNGAVSFGAPLVPRQQLTPTPYAVYAETANASNLVGTVPSANLSGVTLLVGGNAFSGQQTITSGSVGIGTTSPSKLLDVTGTASGVAAGSSIDSSVFVRLNNTSTDGNTGSSDFAGIGFGHDSTRQAIVGGTFGNDYLDFYTGGLLTTPKMRVDFNGYLTLNDPRVGATGTGGQITLNDYYSGTAEGALIDTIGYDGGFPWRTGALEFRPVSRLNIYKGYDVTSASQVALTVVGSSGNVGIGTTNPATALQVNGTVTATSFSGSGSSLTGLSAANLSGAIPSANLPANVTLLDANQTFGGSNNFSSAGILGKNTLQFGVGLTGQEGNAGKIGYETFTSDSLDIVGAGTNGNSRKIKFWAEGGALFNGPATVSGTGLFNGKVGIGTTTPQVMLDVYNPVYAQVAAQFGVANCGAVCAQTDYQEAIRLWNQNGNGQVGIGFTVGGGSFASNAVPGVWLGTSYANHANDFKIATVVGTNLTDRVYINGSNGSVGINTTAPNSDSQLQVKGMMRMGSETGTSEAPNRSIVVRRINSTSFAVGQVVARSVSGASAITLERDGTHGGLVLKVAAGSLAPQIVGVGMSQSASTNVYLFPANNSSTQIFTDAQRIGYCRLSFGDSLNSADMTTVELMRAVDNSVNNGGPWIGTVTSTVNQ